MSKKEVRQAAAELTERLCEKDFLDRSGLSRKNVMMLMNKDHWEEQFARIFPIKKRISCRAVYEICEEPLSLLGHEPEEGWMKFTYQYVCHILYPDAEFKKENAAFSAGAEFYLAVLQFVFDRERAVLPYKPMEDFAFLDDEEASSFECAAEYSRFKKFFAQEYIYEMMRLNAAVSYTHLTLPTNSLV